jgi:ATP-dependent DNA helicase RecQ
MKTSPRDILKTYWGYESFKPSQLLAIESAIEGKDTCVFLPTGGGKSICFQVPALLEDGICIVISPLIALMQDQVENLKSRGIKAQFLRSGMPYREVDQKLDNCVYGNYKFLYLSPERLQQDLVQQRIKKMNVNFIAVDEAHCISQWGHDFRPAYSQIQILRDLHPKVPVIALTATATIQVKKDIAEELELDQPTIVEESFQRANISFLNEFSNDKMNDLFDLLQSSEPSTIVYVRNRSACMELSNFLNKKGLKSTFFHGGISQTEKQKRLASWLAEEQHIMIATNAFGMGIDKANVRQVVHYHLPESMESYYQEAGRAGRDGMPSKAIILYNESDKQRLNNQFVKTIPTFEAVQAVYKAIMSYFRVAYGEGGNKSFDFNFHDFCSRYKLHTILSYNALNLLDRLSILSLDKSFQKKTKLKFQVSSERLIRFIDNNTQFALLVRTLLRTYGGIFEQELTVNTHLLKKKTGFSDKEIYSQLETLEKHGLLEAEFIKQDLSITLIPPREDNYTLNPLRKYIIQYQENKLEKAKTVLNYIEADSQCLQNFILNYFGEKDFSPCGKCSNCLNNKMNAIKGQDSKYYKKIETQVLKLLDQSELNSKEIIQKSNYPKHAMLTTLQFLLEKNKIKLTTKNTYTIVL